MRRLCDEHGALYISDEVICGFGRLGHWFGCQAFDIEPDIVTFAKAVTSGYVPLGGVIVGGKALGMLDELGVEARSRLHLLRPSLPVQPLWPVLR